MGHESPQHEQQHPSAVAAVLSPEKPTLDTCDAVPFLFIGHESPVHLLSLQQSQLSQHEAASLPDAPFFFIGHESFEQHEDLSELTLVLCAYANKASPKTA